MGLETCLGGLLWKHVRDLESSSGLNIEKAIRITRAAYLPNRSAGQTK